MRARHWFLLVPALAALLTAGGCIRSKVKVTSEPSGAIITMNGVNLGTTPVEYPFTWYWYYDFEAEKEGYETAELRRRFRTPIYLIPGLDLIMELIPINIYDTKKVHLELTPKTTRPSPLFDEAAAPAETARSTPGP